MYVNILTKNIKFKKQLVRRNVAKVDATVCVGLLDKMGIQVCLLETLLIEIQLAWFRSVCGLNRKTQCRVNLIS